MNLRQESRIQYLITRYQKCVFALVLNLIGGDKNAAYDVTVASFVKTFQVTSFSLFEEDTFFIRLATTAVQTSREARVMPVVDETDFPDLPPEKRKLLQMTRTALYALPFDAKIPVLLRDQLHLPYRVIAVILKLPEKEARIATNDARIQLRKKIEGILNAA